MALPEEAARVLSRRPLHLELGCGTVKRSADAVGIDQLPSSAVDVVADVGDVLAALPDQSVRSIYSSHFLEHVTDVAGLLGEAARVLEVGGLFEGVVPHFSNPFYYSDPTHRTPFGLYTFAYLVRVSHHSRATPHYADPLPFEVERAAHRFKSYPPHYGRHAVKKALGSLVNSSRWAQEFYEENLCSIFPAQELDFRLRRLP